MKAAILQSNYIPWKGVFDMINQVDIFVFFEDVQFTKRDWRTRNKIKTPNGSQWLTVPVKKASRSSKIFEIEISNEEKWQEKHYKAIKHNYSNAKYFNEYHWILEELYLGRTWGNLSEFNIYTIKLLSEVLGIKTKFVNSKDLETEGIKDDKLIKICKEVGANHYLSGPAAKDYINPQKFKKNEIELEYIEYEYIEYEQLHGEFDNFVTVLDLIFNCGKEASLKIWG